jgi:type III secretory pathway component EscT
MSTSAPPDSEPKRAIFLRDWRLRSKLTAVLVIPAVAFLVLASFGIGWSATPGPSTTGGGWPSSGAR